MTSTSLRADLAVCGVVADPADAPVRGRAGAGPSDDGHVLLGGARTALPLVARSKYTLRGGRLLLDGADLGVDVTSVARPRFYELQTADGIPYENLARLHSANVLATTVAQGSTAAVKTPAQLAEVTEAAVRLDAVAQMIMTTGTSAGRDRGARHLVRCVQAILAVVPDFPIQVQIEPPADLSVLAELKDAGAVSIGIHVESLDDKVRRRWMPVKGSVPMAEYQTAWREAVRVFGRNQVSTYLLVGLGEDPDELVAGAAELIEMGVYPFVVPFRSVAGTLAVDVDRVPPPPSWLVADLTDRVAELLVDAGMYGADQAAGCAACGACSALPSAGA